MVGDLRENAIEWYKGDKQATVSLTTERYITRIKKYAEDYPDECQIVAINDDSSICAHIPTKWIKISPTRKVSDEQKEAAKERFMKLRAEGKV